ncbi:O-succinylbenzoic acid--CoA ligase [Pustulibacterium marinum]|uniref:O-succinylbenzoic acid--CoA ligase n=1 Tax=Pustulibacterium marinum TaxID=1224947 RepID=A0A1I7GCU8_9FLAO|nr:AMP-binding protein [Pustulibacterium marinum]SFU46265.1 O-succinylbenzoic acid--CoA ligase [Pustulibacterium marinum]
MQIPNFKNVHNRFKLNGYHFTREQLNDVAYTFIKEGKPSEVSVGNFLLDWLDDSEYVTVKTSGSTGKPKSIQIEKNKMVNSAIATANHFKLEVGDRALHCLSADYIAGKMMLVRALILGLEIDIVPPDRYPLMYNEKEYDFCAMVPMQVQSSLDELNRVKKLIVGGAQMKPSLKSELQKVSTYVYETYGMTETITHIAARKVNKFKKGKENPYFKALPGVTLKTDERGCLVIHAPQISDEEVVTNDVVNIITHKKFEWLGRIDNTINSGGIKLFPERVEAKLNTITKPFFVTGIPDETLGEKLVVVVEGKAELAQDVKEQVAAADLERYEVPKDVVMLPKFIRTANDKIQRSETAALIHS